MLSLPPIEFLRGKSEGLLAGVLGLKLLGFEMIEGLWKGFPLKLLLTALLISEFLRLGFDLLDAAAKEEDEDLFEGIAIDERIE